MTVVRSRPLKTHLALLFFMAVLAPVVLTAGAVYYYLAGETVADVEQKNLTLARSVAGEVETFLLSPQYVLDNIRRMALPPHAEVDGAETVPDPHALDVPPVEHTAPVLFESIYLIDLAGRVAKVGLPPSMAQHRGSFLGLDLSHKLFFSHTRDTGNPTWSDTFLSLISGRMSLALAVPATGHGVLVGNFNLDLLQDTVERFGRGATQVAVLDREGTVVAHSDPSVAASKLNLSHLDLVRDALAGTDSTREFTVAGSTNLGSAAPIQGPGWVALVTQPAATAFASIRHTAVIAAAIAALTLALGVGLALAVARRYAEPLSQLTAQARGAAAGEYHFTPVHGSYLEVDLLGQTFAEMLVAMDAREGQLAESERKYRELTELLPQVVFETDLGGNVTYANQHGFDLLGFTPEDIAAGLPVTRIIAPQDRRRAVENMQLRMRGAAAPTNEYDVIDAKDHSLSVMIYTNPIVRDGRPEGLRGVLVDITQRKVTEDALRFTQFAMDHLSDAVFFLRAAGEVAYANDAAGTSLGYAKEELLEMGLFDIDPEFNTNRWREHWEQVRVAGTVNLTTRHCSRDGTTREVEVSANHVVFGGEEYICAVARDLTERRALEEQIRQSQKMEAVGTLASGIAHDFNNLLQAISGYTELLLAGATDDRTRGRLGQVAAAAASAAELVQQILAFSRRRTLERRPMDLNHEVHHATEMLRRTLPKMVHIEEHLDPELWHLNADATQVEQVLMNLGTNARDAMPEGGALTLTTRNRTLSKGEHPELAPGPYVELTVADEGTGMNRETRGRIFEPFFTTKGIGEGTGLGLSTAYGIVSAHGGHLDCDSAPGSGTRFTITLPALPEVAPTPRSEAEDDEAPPSRGERVLVVDDEETVRTLAGDTLEASGYRVELAQHGEEALELYRQAMATAGTDSDDRFQAVILDLGMPGMGGRRCLEELLRLDPEARVLVASGYGEPALHTDVLSAGAVAFVAKPYRLRTLCDTLREVLDGPPPPATDT